MSMETLVAPSRLSCSSCGAALPAPHLGARELECSYCGTRTALSLPDVDGLEAPDIYTVPCELTQEEFIGQAQRWMIEGDTTPDDILEKSEVIETCLHYVPVISYSGSYKATWNASSGYYRTESYREWNPSEKRHVEKTRRVTDWSPSDGEVSGSFDFTAWTGEPEDLPAGLVQMLESRTIRSAQLVAATINEVEKSGTDAGGFNSDRVWNARGLFNQVQEMAQRSAHFMVPGDTSRQLRCSTTVKSRTSSNIILPVWMMRYSYQGGHYWVASDAANPGDPFGLRPQDPWRVMRFAVYCVTFWVVLLTWTGLIGVSFYREDFPISSKEVFTGGGLAVTVLFVLFACLKQMEVTGSLARRKQSLKSRVLG